MDILSLVRKGFVFFDGGMGTQLQANGLKAGDCPEQWNISNPDIITKIHRTYFEAGANIATTNTFGANPLKIDNTEEVIFKAVENARNAIYAQNQYVALDIGPTGKLLKPLGDLDFEDAYKAFAASACAGERAGCDLVIIETMNDPYELKAAVLAAKENTKLPVFATFVLDERGKTVTGCDIQAMVALLEGLGVDALGVNCSLGAEEIEKFVPQLIESSSLPVIVNPNAGMPCIIDGKTCYNSTPEKFAVSVKNMAKMGVRIVGGCCGTTPKHIEAVKEALADVEPMDITEKNYTVVSSYSHACF